MSEVYPKDSTEVHEEPQHMIGALRPDILESVQNWVLPGTFSQSIQLSICPELSSDLNRRWHTRRKTSITSGSEPTATLAVKQQAITIATNNFTKIHWFHSLPFQQFQALLTLFSKSFSPFPHGTCLLSVSNQYLALDEIYHPIYAPVPRNATLWKAPVHYGLEMKNGTLTLHGCVFQRLTSRPQLGNPHQTTIQGPKGPNFQTELIPVHSPLLRESYLVSYPPLTYMLKFSGFAYLTSCLEWDLNHEICSRCTIISKSNKWHKVLFKLLVDNSTCTLNASKARSALTHKHAHTKYPNDLDDIGGMNINRHWSRHAFRDIPKAQYTFKSLLVHGILQFTMLITLRCALHRCSSRDIRRWKL